MTGINLAGKNENDWRYIRIYDSVRNGAKGQIGRIPKWENGYVEVDRVWDTTSNIVSNPAGNITSIMDWEKDGVGAAPFRGTWYRQPRQGDGFVLLQDTLDLKWNTGTPAAVTVDEVLGDTNFAILNTARIRNRIDAAKTLLDNAAGGVGTLTFTSVPDLFFGWPRAQAQFNTGRSAFAFAPGLANVQIIAGSYYFPRSFAPVDAAGKDIFEEAVKGRINNALFVDDWQLYHVWWGEVHCGSLVKRVIWNKDWWTLQP
jgi:hypothetical protein